ncbi:MAG: hypothetical protein AAFO91_15105, partial [Bacteroidota bacterium]
MKHSIPGLLFVALVAIGIWYVFTNSDIRLDDPAIVLTDRIERSDIRLSYKYPVGYEAREMEGGLLLGDRMMVGALVFASSTAGLPAISTFVLDEAIQGKDETAVEAGIATTVVPEVDDLVTKEQEIVAWLEDNSNITYYDQRTSELEQVEIDGVMAWHYDATGTYQQEFYTFLYKGRLYFM